MEIINFLNTDTKINCSILCINNGVILTFDEIPDETTIKSGFYLLNEHNYYIQGDYSEYKYIYKIDTDTKTVILAKNADYTYSESTADPSTTTTVTILSPNILYLYDETTGQKYGFGVNNGLFYYEEVDE